jgi:hypothetical protein
MHHTKIGWQLVFLVVPRVQSGHIFYFMFGKILGHAKSSLLNRMCMVILMYQLMTSFGGVGVFYLLLSLSSGVYQAYMLVGDLFASPRGRGRCRSSFVIGSCMCFDVS